MTSIRQSYNIPATTVAVGTTATLLASLAIRPAAIAGQRNRDLAVLLQNAGAADLASFDVRGILTGTATEVVLHNSGYTSPTGWLFATSSDLAALAVGATGWLVMETRAIAEVRFYASVAAGTTNLTISGGLQ